MATSEKILFVMKYRDEPEKFYGIGLSSGLYVSARMINQMLCPLLDSHLIHVDNQEGIGLEVVRYRPTTVIIEDLWVTPEKLESLAKTYPKIKWTVRIHSELPSIATLGKVMQWVSAYASCPNVYVAANSEHTAKELEFLLGRRGWKVRYLPNFYQLKEKEKKTKVDEVIKIGCFGAVRPFKNHLEQAVASLMIGDEYDLPIEFHMNATRLEQNGAPIMENLRSMFRSRKDKLVEHSWLDHATFLKVCAEMDLGMQCSMSESFNIVSADMVSQWVPVVGANTIPWLPPICKADPGDSYSIAECGSSLLSMSRWSIPQRWSLSRLQKHNRTAKNIWLNFIHD